LGKDVAKVPFLTLAAVHPPEAILDVVFCLEYFVIIACLGKRMNNVQQGVTNLSTAPFGPVLTVVSFTDRMVAPSSSRRLNERSKIKRKAFNLWGIAAIGDIFSSFGGFSLIESYDTILACFNATFSLASVAKCLRALLLRDDWCGPCFIATLICSRVQACPVIVGQPNFDHSAKIGAAG
jgi:hypothetical protein